MIYQSRCIGAALPLVLCIISHADAFNRNKCELTRKRTSYTKISVIAIALKVHVSVISELLFWLKNLVPCVSPELPIAEIWVEVAAPSHFFTVCFIMYFNK